MVEEGGCEYTVSSFDTEDCGLLLVSFYPPICGAVSENGHMGHFGSQWQTTDYPLVLALKDGKKIIDLIEHFHYLLIGQMLQLLNVGIHSFFIVNGISLNSGLVVGKDKKFSETF